MGGGRPSGRGCCMGGGFWRVGAGVNVGVAWAVWWTTGCSLDPVGRKTFLRVVDQPLPGRADMKHWAVHFKDSWPWYRPVSRIDRHTFGVRYRHLYCLGEWEVALAECGGPRHGLTLDAWRGGPKRSAVPFPHEGWLMFGRPLPYRLLWLGFAVNIVFYAVILATLFYSSFVLRWFIRRRRGLCPGCAYPRGEADVCSECGKALLQRAGAAT